MDRLTDTAQGYCEMYCKEYSKCFSDPETCVHKAEVAMYEKLKEIEGIVPFDRLLELAFADRDNRCVVLRCKEGDTIYVVGSKKIVKAQIQEMYLLEMTKDVAFMVFFDCDDDCQGCPFNSWYQSYDGEWSCDGEYGNGTVNQSDIGKTVFLTHEAAEAALKQKNE